MINKLKSFWNRRRQIPSYDEKRATILSYKKLYNLQFFIETGTFMGDTIESLRTEFQMLYSVELAESLFLKAEQRFLNYPNVKIVHGDSGTRLPELLAPLKEPALIWLDGHYSGEFMYGNEWIETAKGTLNTPVKKELSYTLNNKLPHVILIDDARLFNGTSDYPTITELKQMVKQTSVPRKLTVKHDIIRIVPR